MGRFRQILTHRFGRINLAVAALLVTVGAVVLVYFVDGGEMFSPGDLNAQPRRNVPRGGVHSHADLANNCAACHAPAWSGETMADRCLACHTNVRDQLNAGGPMHGRLANGNDCSSCHLEHKGARGALTAHHAIDRFDHDCAAFRLTGAHRTIACQECHTTGVFQGTPQACAACHADPPVHKGRFGTNCAQCHSTNTWVTKPANVAQLANFNHDLTAFKLTGKHRTIDCQSCHKDTSSFIGTAQSCISCHAEPLVHKGRFGVACAQCHSTATWEFAATKNVAFNHDLTAFKLTGKHQTLDCASCHDNSAFKGTPQACAACHSEPKIHKGRFSAKCSECHSTHTWDGAEFKHTIFSMTHHGSNNKCAACHNEPNNLKSYTCYNCHHHTPEREALRNAHRKAANLDNCVACHAFGKRKRTAAETEETPATSLTSMHGACPNSTPGLGKGASCPVGSGAILPRLGGFDSILKSAPAAVTSRSRTLPVFDLPADFDAARVRRGQFAHAFLLDPFAGSKLAFQLPLKSQR